MQAGLPHLPVLRAGRPHRSLRTALVAHVAGGEPMAEVSQALPEMITHDLGRAGAWRSALGRRKALDLLEMAQRAGALFAEAELPLGQGWQTPADYLTQVAATTGLPVAAARANLEKLRAVLEEMPAIVAGLTRGVDLSVLDDGWGWEGAAAGAMAEASGSPHDGREPGWRVSYLRQTEALGVVLPSNSPGVHGLWLPAIALKSPLALRPGAREPWTPYRLAQAILAAGGPPEALSLYPSDHAGATQILLSCGRSLLFGDAATVAPWADDPRIEVHGPGRSKVIVGRDRLERWPEGSAAILDLIEESAVANGGRSCINASGVWLAGPSAGAGRALADELARRLAAIAPAALDDPRARLAALAPTTARALSQLVERGLQRGGAEDLTARWRGPERTADVAGCTFLLPTLVWLDAPSHPLAAVELPFPFLTVVEVPREDLLAQLGPTLAATLLSDEPDFVRSALSCPHIRRLHLAPVPTHRLDWTQPHEGDLFQHLYRRRALLPGAAASSSRMAAAER